TLCVYPPAKFLNSILLPMRHSIWEVISFIPCYASVPAKYYWRQTEESINIYMKERGFNLYVIFRRIFFIHRFLKTGKVRFGRALGEMAYTFTILKQVIEEGIVINRVISLR